MRNWRLLGVISTFVLELRGRKLEYALRSSFDLMVNRSTSHLGFSNHDERESSGVAAKLINIYLKSRFVCAGYSSHERVAALHPPIDKLLLEELAHKNLERHARVWRKASRDGWSKMNSDEYERLISLIRDCLHGQPLWMIEEYWRGNQ